MVQVEDWYREAGSAGECHVGIIAEIGVNHDGRVDRGIELIEMAAGAGADAVKLQLFDADRLLSKQSRLAAYQAGQAADAKALLRALSLEPDEMGQLAERARACGLKLIVTPFSPGDVRALVELKVDAVKIASPDAVNTPLLEAAADLDKPMLISTGTCELVELEPAARLLEQHPAGGCLLQCVSSYPTPNHAAALNGIVVLRDRFGLPVGYSDHTQDVLTGALAAAAGAVVLEKHVTYDRQAKGPDHAASADPGQFAEYVRLVREAQAMLGPKAKGVLAVERDVREVSRQSVAAARDLPAGHILGEADLTVMRPGTGIPARELKTLIGQLLIRPVRAGHLLDRADVAVPKAPHADKAVR